MNFFTVFGRIEAILKYLGVLYSEARFCQKRAKNVIIKMDTLLLVALGFVMWIAIHSMMPKNNIDMADSSDSDSEWLSKVEVSHNFFSV